VNVVSVTAKPVPNSEPIAINTRVDSYDIDFKPNSTVNYYFISTLNNTAVYIVNNSRTFIVTIPVRNP